MNTGGTKRADEKNAAKEMFINDPDDDLDSDDDSIKSKGDDQDEPQLYSQLSVL